MRTMFLFSTFCATVYRIFVNGHFEPKEKIESSNQGSLDSHVAREGGAMDTIQNGHN